MPLTATDWSSLPLLCAMLRSVSRPPRAGLAKPKTTVPHLKEVEEGNDLPAHLESMRDLARFGLGTDATRIVTVRTSAIIRTAGQKAEGQRKDSSAQID